MKKIISIITVTLLFFVGVQVLGQPKVAAKSTTDHQITVKINGKPYKAHLNNTRLARDITKQLPLTLRFRSYASGFDEKIADLNFTPHLGNSSYSHHGSKGKIAYWQPDNRLVFYYGEVGNYDGINVIGEFDSAKASQAIKKLNSNQRVTIQVNR